VLLVAWMPIWRSRSRTAGSAEASAMERCMPLRSHWCLGS
jgi:hypothetical protein